MIKVVFDTNVWVTYFLNGKLKELVLFKYDHNVIFFRSLQLSEELSAVLSRPKFKKYLSRPVDEYIHFFYQLTELIDWVNTKNKISTYSS